MQYFVSIEKKSYFYWQIELLIHSFKRYGLEDQLVIAIADTEEKAAVPKNLSKCNFFLHENYGKKIGYLQANKPLSILEARKKEILRKPFVILEPDMVLLEPIQDAYKEDIIGNYTQYLELNELEKDHKEYYNFLQNFHKKWQPFGPIFIVNRDEDKLYNRVVENCIKLIKNNVFWWPLDMLAWIVTFLEFNYKCKIIKEEEVLLESYIHTNSKSNFLHYCHNPKDGFFSKYKYKKVPENTMIFEPFYDILAIKKDFSLSSTILKEVVEDFLKNY
jgi:hypothetical protein